jgi:hypothetical protein
MGLSRRTVFYGAFARQLPKGKASSCCSRLLLFLSPVRAGCSRSWREEEEEGKVLNRGNEGRLGGGAGTCQAAAGEGRAVEVWVGVERPEEKENKKNLGGVEG